MTFLRQNVSPVSLALNNTFCLSFPWLLSILRRLREAHGIKDLCSSLYSYPDRQVVVGMQDMVSMVQAQLTKPLCAHQAAEWHAGTLPLLPALPESSVSQANQ